MGQSKKLRRAMNSHWTLQTKKFVQDTGALKLPVKYLFGLITYYPAVNDWKTRRKYARAIMKAPRLTRRGKILSYIAKHFSGSKGLKEELWIYYVVHSGACTFHCRLHKTEKKLIHIEVEKDDELVWTLEKVALLDMGKVLTKLYRAGSMGS